VYKNKNTVALWKAWVYKLSRSPIPLCFESKRQWDAWVALAKDASLKHRGPLPASYCTDCSPEYQHRMSKENRCGHPETRFVQNGPASFEGKKKR